MDRYIAGCQDRGRGVSRLERPLPAVSKRRAAGWIYRRVFWCGHWTLCLLRGIGQERKPEGGHTVQTDFTQRSQVSITK